VAVIYFSDWRLVPLRAIGLGIVAYALAVAFYSLLGIWRLRRAMINDAWLAQPKSLPQPMPATPVKTEARSLLAVCATEDAPLHGK
jgi:hypothetical protein